MPSRHRLTIALAAAVAVLAAALGGGWLWAASAFEARWQAWIEARQAEGYRFPEEAPRLGGFPLRIAARLAAPAVAAPQGWRWQGPPVAAEAAVWTPFTVRLAFPGRHIVELPGRQPLAVDAASARGRVRLAAGGPAQARAALGGLRVEGLPVGPVAAEAAELALGPRHAAPGGRPAVDLALVARGLALPEGIETPLGRGVDRLDVAATVEGRIPAGPPAEALEAWRRSGGVVQVRRLEIAWGPLTLTADGSLALDKRLRPLGAFSAEVRGLPATLDRLVQAGLVEPDDAALAKTGIEALGQRDAESGETVIRVPISLQDGRLYLGPVALLRLSPVL